MREKRTDLESKIDQYVALTGDDRESVSNRFHRITKERRRQLILWAKGICRRCHGQLVWSGEGRACLCRDFRGPRRRHWVERLMSRLQHDEGMTEEEARLTMTRGKIVVPIDFRERCEVEGGVTELARHYGVSRPTIYGWIKSLGLKRRIIYVSRLARRLGSVTHDARFRAENEK